MWWVVGGHSHSGCSPSHVRSLEAQEHRVFVATDSCQLCHPAGMTPHHSCQSMAGLRSAKPEGGRGALLPFPDPCGACGLGHPSSRQPAPALTLVGSCRGTSRWETRIPGLCRRGPASHNPGRALPPQACPYEGWGRRSGMQTESPRGCRVRERVREAPLITSLPRTGNRPTGLVDTSRGGASLPCSKADPRGQSAGLSAA